MGVAHRWRLSILLAVASSAGVRAQTPFATLSEADPLVSAAPSAAVALADIGRDGDLDLFAGTANCGSNRDRGGEPRRFPLRAANLLATPAMLAGVWA